MSDQLDTGELRRAIRQATQQLDQQTEEERRRIIQEEIDRAMAEELAERRTKLEREAQVATQEIKADSRAEEAQNARIKAPGNLLLLLLIFLILYLMAAATGRPDIVTFPGSRVGPTPLPARLNDGASPSGAAGLRISSADGAVADDVAALNSLSTAPPEIGARFREYYEQRGGEAIFGRPLSPELLVNGRTIQWFERARLEEWPEHQGTPYAIQGGRLGVEFTQGLDFPTQAFFVSRPGLRYFGETNHGVSERFLAFWEQHGGLDTFGYPISDEVQERLPSDGQAHTVQYFERARLEYHPQHAGTPFETQIGLLGRALFLNESQPDIIAAPKPTAVPLP